MADCHRDQLTIRFLSSYCPALMRLLLYCVYAAISLDIVLIITSYLSLLSCPFLVSLGDFFLVMVHSRLWDVCSTSCASLLCPLVKAKWPYVMAVSPYQITPATLTTFTALLVSFVKWFRNMEMSTYVFFSKYNFYLVSRVHAGTGSRQ